MNLKVEIQIIKECIDKEILISESRLRREEEDFYKGLYQGNLEVLRWMRSKLLVLLEHEVTVPDPQPETFVKGPDPLDEEHA